MPAEDSTPEGIRWASYASTEDPLENSEYRDYILGNTFSHVPTEDGQRLIADEGRARLAAAGHVIPQSSEGMLEELVKYYREHRPSMPGEAEASIVIAVAAADVASARATGTHWIMGSNGWPVLADGDGRERFDALCASYDSVYRDGKHPLVLLDHAFPLQPDPGRAR